MKQQAAIALALFAAACSPSKSTVEEEQPGRAQKAPLRYYEATLNPSDYDEDITNLQSVHPEDSQFVELNIPKDSVSVEEEILQGFRIQIFASASIDEANSTRISATMRLAQDSVYVVYDPPVYKVRVGDFPSRYTANQRLPLLIEKGYPDAWVVPDRIVQRKITRIPRQ
ncbi:MAG: SPOR domain-containing protein [Ignavibacteriales bacterium]|nr:SPOR domain-containing protein [Ignavibacteriales bacterium]